MSRKQKRILKDLIESIGGAVVLCIEIYTFYMLGCFFY